MKANSTKKKSACKLPKNFKKPRDFPLNVHKASGQWCKKIRGHLYYYGRISDDPKGVAALEKWIQEKDDLLAGREPRDKLDSLTVRELVNQFLSDKAEKRDNDELSPRSFRGYYDTLAIVVDTFGKGRAVIDLRPDDFRKLRSKISVGRGPATMRCLMQQVRSLFLFAFEEGLIREPIRYGKAFQKPTLDVLRRERENHRQKHGDRMFESNEIQQILAASNQPMRSMVLLGANCGFGQSDISGLPITAVDLEKGWIDFARVKTAVQRKIPLWPETVASLLEWLAIRTTAKNPDDNYLMFLNKGYPWVRVSREGIRLDAIGRRFNKLLLDLNLKRPKTGFYSLRHGFETIAGETTDQVAVDAVMGHVAQGMAAHYRERISDERLRRVCESVRKWLFADTDGIPPKINSEICDPNDPCDPVEETVDNEQGRKGRTGRKITDKSFSGDAPVLRLFAG